MSTVIPVWWFKSKKQKSCKIFFQMGILGQNDIQIQWKLYKYFSNIHMVSSNLLNCILLNITTIVYCKAPGSNRWFLEKLSNLQHNSS